MYCILETNNKIKYNEKGEKGIEKNCKFSKINALNEKRSGAYSQEENCLKFS